jgi:hypothetical protein
VAREGELNGSNSFESCGPALADLGAGFHACVSGNRAWLIDQVIGFVVGYARLIGAN